MTNSRAKGKRGELEACKALAEHLNVNPRRGQQYCGVAGDADIVDHLPGTHCEVKRYKAIAALKFLRQAEQDCGGDLPFVMMREDGDTEWAVMLRLKDLLDFVDRVSVQRALEILDR